MKKIICLLACLMLAGCAEKKTETEYACRTIDYYEYGQPAPKAEENDSQLSDSVLLGDFRLSAPADSLHAAGAEVYFVPEMNLFRIDSMNAKDTEKTLLDLAAETKKKNIYLVLGLNELGSDETSSVTDQIKWSAGQVRSANSSASVYICLNYHPRTYGNMPAKDVREKTDALNEGIQKAAEELGCYALDLRELDGLDGLLKEEYSDDGLYLNAKGIDALKELISTHAVRSDDYVKKVCE